MAHHRYSWSLWYFVRPWCKAKPRRGSHNSAKEASIRTTGAGGESAAESYSAKHLDRESQATHFSSKCSSRRLECPPDPPDAVSSKRPSTRRESPPKNPRRLLEKRSVGASEGVKDCDCSHGLWASASVHSPRDADDRRNPILRLS